MAITLQDIAKASPQTAKMITDYQSGVTNPMMQQRLQSVSGSMGESLSGITPYDMDPGKVYGYINPYYTDGYTSNPQELAKGYGGASFGGGSGGDARFTPGTFGSGLWSMGIDYKDKGAAEAAQKWYDKQPLAARKEIDSYWTNNKKSGNAAQDIMAAVDWRQQDVARKIQKENGFLDSTLGQIVSTLGQVALGAVPGIGPGLAAAMGAITGGLQGGLGGAVLGGLGGYGSGQLGSSLATNGIGGTINNAVSGFQNLFGGGTQAPIVNGAANIVPGTVGITSPTGIGGSSILNNAVSAINTGNDVAGLVSGGSAPAAGGLTTAQGAGTQAVSGAGAGGVNPASLGSMLGPSAGTAASAGVLAGAGGLATAAGAGLGATAAQAAGTAGVSAATGGASAGGAGAAPVTTPSANPANVVAGAGGAAAGGSSTISSILGLLGGTGGLGASGMSLLQGILGQMGGSDLEALAKKLNTTNTNMTGYIPPMSYRDSILNNLDMIMNRPGQLMEQKPYSDYMDYTQRAVERKMNAQGYGGVGQSTNTADAVSRAVMESMAGIVQNDRKIATEQLLPFFNVGVQGATNMNNGALAELMAFNNQNSNNSWTQIAGGAAGILKNIFDS